MVIYADKGGLAGESTTRARREKILETHPLYGWQIRTRIPELTIH